MLMRFDMFWYILIELKLHGTVDRKELKSLVSLGDRLSDKGR